MVTTDFPHSDRIKFFNAKFSYDKLKQTQEHIDLLFDKLGIESTYIDEEINKVVVEITDHETKAKLLEIFGDEILDFRESSGYLTNLNRREKTRPVVGGLYIIGTGGCTGAFSAKSYFGTETYYLTAGHCGQLET